MTGQWAWGLRVLHKAPPFDSWPSTHEKISQLECEIIGSDQDRSIKKTQRYKVTKFLVLHRQHLPRIDHKYPWRLTLTSPKRLDFFPPVSRRRQFHLLTIDLENRAPNRKASLKGVDLVWMKTGVRLYCGTEVLVSNCVPRSAPCPASSSALPSRVVDIVQRPGNSFIFLKKEVPSTGFEIRSALLRGLLKLILGVGAVSQKGTSQRLVQERISSMGENMINSISCVTAGEAMAYKFDSLPPPLAFRAHITRR